METKICSKCKVEKLLCDFHNSKNSKDGKNCQCKSCTYKNNVEWRKNNREKQLEINRNYLMNNRNKINENTRRYRENNKEKEILRNRVWKENNKEKTTESRKKWREKNKEHIKEYKRKYENHKIKTDTLYKLKKILRNNIIRGIKHKKFTTPEIIGCDYIFFKTYFESLFIENMNWDNHGEWHIDHKIPLSTAKNEEELYKLNHYTNLQPLWSADNLKKSNKII